MKKYLLIIILLIVMIQVFAQEKYQIARMHYTGGGDWYNNPDILPNLSRYINNEVGVEYFSEEQVVVKPGDNDIFNVPFIFMTGHGNVTFKEKEIENLRNYLLRGGFLYVDDDYGLDESFRREIKKILPEYDLVELPANHELFNCYYKFENGIPKIHKHDEKRPQAFAIFDDNGKMMVLYTFESNISDGWASPHVHKDPEEVREIALKMGFNIFYYLMSGL